MTEAPVKTTALPYRAWIIPNVPCKPYRVPANSFAEATRIINLLGGYDAFQFDNGHKGDYSNAAGVERWNAEDNEWEEVEEREILKPLAAADGEKLSVETLAVDLYLSNEVAGDFRYERGDGDDAIQTTQYDAEGALIATYRVLVDIERVS